MHNIPTQGWKTHKSITRIETETSELKTQNIAGRDRYVNETGVAVGLSNLTRSMKHTRTRQLVPTYNASTPFTRLENTQD